MTTVVNFFGSAGAGKSTTAAATFSALKYQDINCELVQEYAKSRVWERAFHTLSNQIYIFGKQHHAMFRLLDQVDYVLTDSPIILGLLYGVDLSPSFRSLVLEEFNKCDNVNIFIHRVKKYQTIGRLQSEQESDEKHTELLKLLEDCGICYHTIDGTPEAPSKVLEIMREYGHSV